MHIFPNFFSYLTKGFLNLSRQELVLSITTSSFSMMTMIITTTNVYYWLFLLYVKYAVDILYWSLDLTVLKHILYQDRVLFRLHILCDGQSTTILPSVSIVAILVSYTLAAAITTTDNGNTLSTYTYFSY